MRFDVAAVLWGSMQRPKHPGMYEQLHPLRADFCKNGWLQSSFPHWKQTITHYLKSREVIPGVQKLPFFPVSTSGLCDRGSQQSTNCSLGRWPKSCFAQWCCRALTGFVCCLPSPPHQLSAPGCPSPQAGAVQLLHSPWGWWEASPRQGQRLQRLW